MTSNDIATLVIDYGGVLRNSQHDISELLGDGAEQLRTALARRGTSARPYSAHIEELRTQVEKGVRRLRAREDELKEVLVRARARGLAVVLLSNRPHEGGYETDRWDEMFDAVVLIASGSAEAKPAGSAYTRALSAVGSTASKAAFIDDAEAGVNGARRAGFAETLLHRRIAATIRFIEQLG